MLNFALLIPLTHRFARSQMLSWNRAAAAKGNRAEASSPPGSLYGLREESSARSSRSAQADNRGLGLFRYRQAQAAQEGIDITGAPNGGSPRADHQGGRQFGAFRARDEWEAEIAENEPDLSLARDTALEPLVNGKLRRQLKPIFETRVRGRSIRSPMTRARLH